MIKSTMQFRLLGLLAIAVAGTPLTLGAQEATTTNKPAVINPSARPLPFRGKLRAVDIPAQTITMGMTPIIITSETKITKDGKPATLADGVVGENVSGQFKKTADGKIEALVVNFGKKPKPAPPTSNTKTNTP